MLRFLKGFFGKPTPPDNTPKPEPVAPYKVEAPVVTPVMVPPEPIKLTVDGHGDVHEVKSEAKPKKVPAKKAATKKPAAMKAPAKTRAPRKPKATK